MIAQTNVKRAKQAQRAIEKKMSVAVLDDDDLEKNVPTLLDATNADPNVDAAPLEQQRADDFGASLSDVSVSSRGRLDDSPVEIANGNQGDMTALKTPDAGNPKRVTKVNGTVANPTIPRSSHSKASKKPRLSATPRLGQTPSALFSLTRTLQEPPTGHATGTISQTAARRLNIDKALEAISTQNNDSALLAMMMMMDKREHERSERQEEADRKAREEAAKREARLEDQRREDQRMNRMFMMMMAQMMGGKMDSPFQPDLNG